MSNTLSYNNNGSYDRFNSLFIFYVLNKISLIKDNMNTGITGPEGPTGPQGIQGIQGVQGIQGEQGNQGIQGNLGETGPQGIQGFQGEKGIKGDKGDNGDVGPTGPSIINYSLSSLVYNSILLYNFVNINSYINSELENLTYIKWSDEVNNNDWLFPANYYIWNKGMTRLDNYTRDESSIIYCPHIDAVLFNSYKSVIKDIFIVFSCEIKTQDKLITFFRDENGLNSLTYSSINNTFIGSAINFSSVYYIDGKISIGNLENTNIFDGNIHLLHILNVDFNNFTEIFIDSLTFPIGSKIYSIGFTKTYIETDTIYKWVIYNYLR